MVSARTVLAYLVESGANVGTVRMADNAPKRRISLIPGSNLFNDLIGGFMNVRFGQQG